MSYYSHESACIDDGAQIGEGTKIWHFSHVSSSAVVGNNCTLGQNVFISAGALVGSNVKIQNNVSVFDGVTLEDDVFCGPNCTFTNVHNPRAFIERKDEFRKTVVRQGATLGANCTIRCGLTIGQYAFIGAGTVVLEDVLDYALVVGNPGKQIGWITRNGTRLNLPVQGNGEDTCSETGNTYRLEGALLSIVESGN